MAPALPAGLIGREAAACVLLGAVLGGARALFPEKGRGAFLPDVLLVGALLLIGLTYYRIDWARHPEKYQDLVEQAEKDEQEAAQRRAMRKLSKKKRK